MSPDCRTNRTGYSVFLSCLIFAIIESTISECSYCIATPSRRPRVSPYAMNENFLTSRDCASGGKGVAGTAMALTRSGSWAATGRARGNASKLPKTKTTVSHTIKLCFGTNGLIVRPGNGYDLASLAEKRAANSAKRDRTAARVFFLRTSPSVCHRFQTKMHSAR